MELMIGFLLGVFFGWCLQRGSKKASWRLVSYYAFVDTSFDTRAPSCKFTVVNLDTNEVHNRFSYGRQYSQGELIQAAIDGFAHKLGAKDNLI